MSYEIDTSSVSILVTDDNLVTIKLITNMLEKEGYRTFSAMNGAECIDASESLKPDLILLDISMPQMGGIEVCTILKKDQKTREIPIIFVTANRQTDVIKMAFDAGGADYILKPINRIELLARIKSVLIQKILTQKLVEKEKFSGVLEMAGAVCHELNQPIQVAMGYADILLTDVTEDHPLRPNLRRIKDQIKRMGELTGKLMRITKYETKHYLEGVKIIDIDKASVK